MNRLSNIIIIVVFLTLCALSAVLCQGFDDSDTGTRLVLSIILFLFTKDNLNLLDINCIHHFR